MIEASLLQEWLKGLSAMISHLRAHDWLIDGNDNIAFAIRHQGHCLFRKQSDYQLVEVFETPAYGRTLTVDGLVMCTEKDEHAYHEMIVHVPAFAAAGSIQDVLVIGGGDGGTIRELLRHPNIQTVTLVEIDAVVIEAAQACLPSLTQGFVDPKLKITIADGIQYLHDATSESYDLVIIDSSDPVGPAEGLFSADFYQDVWRCLRPHGILTVQSESPWFHRQAFIDLYQCLASIFTKEATYPYLAFIPTYPTGMWSFIYAAKDATQPWQNIDCNAIARFVEQENLQYYNAGIHQAAFQLPTFVQQLCNLQSATSKLQRVDG